MFSIITRESMKNLLSECSLFFRALKVCVWEGNETFFCRTQLEKLTIFLLKQLENFFNYLAGDTENLFLMINITIYECA